MDSLQGVPVEYKLNAFNMPRTGTTLCHPKIGYVDPTRNPALTRELSIHLWAALMETTHAPLHQTDKNHGNSKKSIPHTSDDTRCHLNLLNFS